MKKTVFSCSFGKDSLAAILLARKYKWDIDLIIYSEVMYDHSRDISAEYPEHREWIYNYAIPKLKKVGIQRTSS